MRRRVVSASIPIVLVLMLGCGSRRDLESALTTGGTGASSLDHRAIHAYTDLLLHDMGPDLASVCSATAAPSVWRTAPLMGARFRQAYLHDGSAPGIDGAIHRHGGEALRARAAFERLSPEQRALVIRFVHSL